MSTPSTTSWCLLRLEHLRLVEPTGVRDVQLQAGVSYSRTAGIAHNVVNVNDHEFCFVEIELK